MTWYVVAFVFHLSGDVNIKVLRDPHFEARLPCVNYIENTPTLGLELVIKDVTRLKLLCVDEKTLGINSL